MFHVVHAHDALQMRLHRSCEGERESHEDHPPDISQKDAMLRT